jgi:hypothetical protein
MKYLAQRLFVTGVGFLLAPIWTFLIVDKVTLWYVENHLPQQYYTLLGFDYMRFSMEFETFHYLFWIGVWITCGSLILKGVLKIQSQIKKGRS